MPLTEHTQTLTAFHEKATETLDRINRTGEAEILTVDGQARAVVLSPAAYDELARDAQLTRDVEMIRKSMKQIEAGQYQDADTYFDGLRAKLLAMKGQQEIGAGK